MLMWTGMGTGWGEGRKPRMPQPYPENADNEGRLIAAEIVLPQEREHESITQYQLANPENMYLQK